MHFSVATSPHLAAKHSVSRVMLTVLLALLPGIITLTVIFGIGILLNIAIAISAALAFEALALWLRGRPVKRHLFDFTAVVTAVLFALCLPPTVAWWVTVIGVGFAILLAKQLYGGLGHNPFNPAMVGFVVVIICFPTELTLWLAPFSELSMTGAVQLIFVEPASAIDAYTAATPLVMTANDIANSKNMALHTPIFAGLSTQLLCYIAIAISFLLGGLLLIVKKMAAWQAPLGMLIAIIIASTGLWLLNASAYPMPGMELVLGASILGAFFIVTDPVSGCTSRQGRWIFGLGVGFLVVVLRNWSNYPEGVAFAVLLMNLTAPMLDHYSKPRVYGSKTRPKPASKKTGGAA